MIFILLFLIIIFGLIVTFQRALSDSDNDNKYFGLILPLITFSFSVFTVFNSITTSQTFDLDVTFQYFIGCNIPTFILYMIYLDTRIKHKNRNCWYNNSNTKKEEFGFEYDNLIKAVETLEKAIKQDEENQDLELNNMFRDNLIQRFEYCYEISLKILMEYMIYSGYKVGISPKSVLEKAYQNSIIAHEEVWIDMISDSNISSHEYNDIYKRIKNNYILEFQVLIQKLKEVF